MKPGAGIINIWDAVLNGTKINTTWRISSFRNHISIAKLTWSRTRMYAPWQATHCQNKKILVTNKTILVVYNQKFRLTKDSEIKKHSIGVKEGQSKDFILAPCRHLFYLIQTLLILKIFQNPPETHTCFVFSGFTPFPAFRNSTYYLNSTTALLSSSEFVSSC